VLNLFLLRHAEAEPFSPFGDSQRPVSHGGREQLNALLARRHDQLQEAGLWLVSPYLRTQQTCQQLYFGAGRVETIEQLTPESHPTTAIAAIDMALESLPNSDQTQSVVAVTHMPLIGDLIEQLCGQRIGVSTATLTLIQFDIFGPQLGTLVWSDNP